MLNILIIIGWLLAICLMLYLAKELVKDRFHRRARKETRHQKRYPRQTARAIYGKSPAVGGNQYRRHPATARRSGS